MGLSIFLAKLIGIYMLIVAAVWLIYKKQIDLSIKDIIDSKGLIAFSGLINILLGLAIVIGHSIWELNWMGVITILGYILIIQGIIRLIFAEKADKYMPGLISKGYWPIIAILIVLGGFLTYSRFMVV